MSTRPTTKEDPHLLTCSEEELRSEIEVKQGQLKDLWASEEEISSDLTYLWNLYRVRERSGFNG